MSDTCNKLYKTLIPVLNPSLKIGTAMDKYLSLFSK